MQPVHRTFKELFRGPYHNINNNSNNTRGFTSQNHDMVTRDTVGEGSGNFGHLVFFNVR